MDKISILDSCDLKEESANTTSYCNKHEQCIGEAIIAFKDSLSLMQKNLEIMHCEIDNFFSNNDYVLSGLMSNINKLEDKIKATTLKNVTTNPVLSSRGEVRGIQNNLTPTIKPEKNKSLDPADGRQHRSDQLQAKNKKDLNMSSDEIDLEINKLINLAQLEVEFNDLINNTNSNADELMLYINKIDGKINKHESVEQMQKEFNYLTKHSELLTQQTASLNEYTGQSSDDAMQKKNEVLQKSYYVKKNIEILLRIFQGKLQKAWHAENVINNFRDFIFSLEQEINLICIKIKNNHYVSVYDGVNELISKQQDMQDRQVELNNIKESLIPNGLLNKKIEILRKFIDIQEKISHFLLDIKIFNAI